MQRSELISLASACVCSFLCQPAVYVGRIVRDCTTVDCIVSYVSMYNAGESGPYASHDLAREEH